MASDKTHFYRLKIDSDFQGWDSLMLKLGYFSPWLALFYWKTLLVVYFDQVSGACGTWKLLFLTVTILKHQCRSVSMCLFVRPELEPRPRCPRTIWHKAQTCSPICTTIRFLRGSLFLLREKLRDKSQAISADTPCRDSTWRSPNFLNWPRRIRKSDLKKRIFPFELNIITVG